MNFFDFDIRLCVLGEVSLAPTLSLIKLWHAKFINSSATMKINFIAHKGDQYAKSGHDGREIVTESLNDPLQHLFRADSVIL